MAGASSSAGDSRKYDVFINLRGEDTRRCFVCHLYQALKQKALDVFIDSEELRKGDDLSELYKAIQDSRLSIVVFSKDYASSKWCLKELVLILECMDRQSQIVVPIFYEVDPSHVRNLEESFAEAFARHENNSNVDKLELESWKSSLRRATNLAGYHSRNYRDDTQLIGSIVEDIFQKLIHISRSETEGLIGMDSHMDELDSLLQLWVDDFRIVGIWGVGGIGKSTIAQAVFDRIGYQFEHKCFLDNVKEGFITKNGAVQMVEKLLSKILKVNDQRTLDGGLNMIRERLRKRKTLLVLDDVDSLHQIETLIGEKPTFGRGSRIIITTRDKKLLAGFLIYQPKLFTNKEALELFSRYAFRTNKYSENYDAMSRRAVEYAYCLPLALKVLGALLNDKTVQEWEYELEKFKKIPTTLLDNEIKRVVLASYDGLDEWQKSIFLDIACFFNRKDKDFVTKFHESYGFFPDHNRLRVLVDRSLVTISYFGELKMHDLIQEVGRDIIYQESTKDLGRRSRLWSYEDVLQVLPQKTMEQANIRFKNKDKTVFAHHHCWRYLKDAITWKIPAETNSDSNHGNSSSQFTETQETHTSLDGDGDEEPLVSISATKPNQRPIRKKVAKRKIIEEGQASDMVEELRRYNNIMEAEAIRKKEKDKHMLRVFQESARREEEKADLEYLKIDTTYMPPEHREFFEHKKTEIYNKMRFRGSNSSSSGNPSVTLDFDTSSDYHVDPNPGDPY